MHELERAAELNLWREVAISAKAALITTDEVVQDVMGFCVAVIEGYLKGNLKPLDAYVTESKELHQRANFQVETLRIILKAIGDMEAKENGGV